MATSTMSTAVVKAVDNRLQALQAPASYFQGLLGMQSVFLDRASIDYTEGLEETPEDRDSLSDPGISSIGSYRNREFDFARYSEKIHLDRERLAFQKAFGAQPDSEMDSAMDYITGVIARKVGLLDRFTERVCRDAILNGSLALKGGTLDYGRASTLSFTVSPAWSNGSANPLGDLTTGCERIVEQSGGAIMPSRVVFGTTAYQNLFADSQYQRIIDSRNIQKEYSEMLYKKQTDGSVFVGLILLPSGYQLEGYVYNCVHNNSGTIEKFMPANQVLITGDRLMDDARLIYGGAPVVEDQINGGIADAFLSAPGIRYIKGKWIAQIFPDQNRESIICRVESRLIPGISPNSINGTARLTVT